MFLYSGYGRGGSSTAVRRVDDNGFEPGNEQQQLKLDCLHHTCCANAYFFNCPVNAYPL